MPLEADIAYVHLLDGIRQPEVPSGFMVRSAPRRAARGRDRDLLVLAVYAGTASSVSLVELAANVYFGTPGSVTSAAREAMGAVNAKLLDTNRFPPVSGLVTCGLTCAVLRADDLYIAQAGPGQCAVLRADAAERFPDIGRDPAPPLGQRSALEVQYFHTTLAAADTLLLAEQFPMGWHSTALAALHTTGLESAVARLTRLAGPQANAQALVARFVTPEAAAPKGRAITAEPQPIAAAAPPPMPSPVAVDEPESVPADDSSALAGIIARLRASPTMGDRMTEPKPPVPVAASTPPPRPEEAPPVDAPVAPVLIGDHVYKFEEDPNAAEWPAPPPIEDEEAEPRPGGFDARAWLASARSSFIRWFTRLPLNRADSWMKDRSATLGTSIADSGDVALRRLLPEGAVRPDVPLRISNSTLVAVAVLLPVIIAALVGAVYIQRGRDQQFNDYLSAARLEAGLARTAPDALAAKPHWLTVLSALDQAETIFPGRPDAAQLRAEAQQSVDALEGIQRLAFAPLVPGGFGPTARIGQLVVNGNEVYALDTAHQTVYRAVLSEDGRFGIDRNFQCQGGPVGSFVVKNIVDIVWLNTPNVEGQPVLLAVDDNGVLMYCKPDGSAPDASQLIAPDSGWKSPRAAEIYADRLYIFDPGANQIWFYDRIGGVFSERPKSYFTAHIFDLSNAVNFAIAGGEVYIWRADGGLMFCTRDANTLEDACVENVLFSDSRTGHPGGSRLDDLQLPVMLYYDPPPEPSLYLLDGAQGSAYQLSLKLVLQRQYRDVIRPAEPITAMAIGPDKELYFATGNTVLWGQRP
ncbi:MAG: hypothetical protein HY679_04230 [Chloroflexi bacterium]|nr:hypothetical protein [Chloroflexota bacterium]